MQRPHGPEDLVCPYHRRSMAKVCHACPLWIQVRGFNPNTGEPMDRWDCAHALMPVLLIENTQKQREGGAAIETLRNVLAATKPRAAVPVIGPAGGHAARLVQEIEG